MLYVRFAGGGQLISVTPQLVCLLPNEPGCHKGTAMTAESPDLAAAKRLLDIFAKRGGFCFQRAAPGPDGPL